MAEIIIVENNTAKALDALSEEIEKGLEAVGLQAEGYAQLNCPVDTGFLRNSITHALGGEPPSVSSYASDDGSKHGSYNGTVGTKGDRTMYIGSNVEYAAPVEENDSAEHKTGKAHYLRDALLDHKEEYKQIITLALMGGMDN